MKDDSVVLYVLLSCILFLVLTLFVIWFFNTSQKKLIKAKFDQQAKDLEFQNELLVSTIKTQETERERISKELHDDVTSKLNIIHLNMHLLKKRTDDNIETVKIVDHIEMSLKESIERTRTISHELIPIMLIKFGLSKGLHDLVSSINMTGMLNVELEGDYHLKITDNFKELHIYRILQELLNNTVKYASAKQVNIDFEIAENNTLVLLYRDDGIGMELSETSKGMGFNNINTRVKLLQGESKISTGKNKGFQFTTKFPNHD